MRPIVIALIVLMLGSLGLASPTPVSAAVAPGDSTSWAYDTWYHDVETHWARPYLLTLWEEGVTHGEAFVVPGDGWEWHTGYRFHPDAPMDRGQLLFMMSPLFQLEPDHSTPTPWPDLTPQYWIYGVPAFGEVQAAATAWDLEAPGTPLRLTHQGTRFDAVAFVLSALDLTEYAEQLTDAEVAAILAPFGDASALPSHHRQRTAAAVQLGLIIGYADETLRMDRTLTRAEGATILYRSCLMRVVPEYGVFYPDGDGYREELSIEVVGLRNGNHRGWEVQIVDGQQETVRQLPAGGPGWGNLHPVQWDGRDADGTAVPPGRYYVRGYLEDRRGERFHATAVPVRVRHRRLQGALEPSPVTRGESVQVTARTQGGAHGVQLQAPDGTHLALTATGEDSGWIQWEAPLDTRSFNPGTHTCLLQAAFEGSSRAVSLTLEIQTETAPPGDNPPPPDPVERGDLLTHLIR